MNEAVQLKSSLLVESLVDLWRRYCELHTSLLSMTQHEYLLLLESNTDKLEELVATKDSLIKEIKELDLTKDELVLSLTGSNLPKIYDLLAFLDSNGFSLQHKYLIKYNTLLTTLISDIQAQNKKNQFFLNKAILSLQSLKESFGGERSKFKTYGSKGTTSVQGVR